MKCKVKKEENLMSFGVDLVKSLGTSISRRHNTASDLEVLDENVDDLAEPVDVEEVERRARDDADELVLELDLRPRRCLHERVEDGP